MDLGFRIGLVGAGKMGQLHLKKLAAISQVKVVGFYDPSEEVSAVVESRFGVRRYGEVVSLLSDCDAVVVATPTPLHYPIACKALALRKHVLIEKPPCQNIEEARHLDSLAAEVGCVMQPGFLERYRFEAMLRNIDYSLEGIEHVEFQRLTPQVGRESNISVIDDTMIHDIDLLLSLNLGPVTSVSSTGYTLVTSLLDVASARVQFQNGHQATLSTSRVSDVAQRTMRIITSDAFLSLNFLTNEVFYGQRGISSHSSSGQRYHFEIDPLHEEWLDFIGRCTTGIGKLSRYPSVTEILSLRDQIETPLLVSRPTLSGDKLSLGVTT